MEKPETIDLTLLKKAAPTILANSEHLLEWLESEGCHNKAVLEELQQTIFLLHEAGVNSIHSNGASEQTSTEVKEADKNGWEGFEKLRGTVQASEDWSVEHDHYLYGTPKDSSKLAQ